MNRYVTRIDYRNSTLTFYDPSTFVYKGYGMIFTGWLDVENYFLVPMTIDGVTVNLALDTGAFATIMTKGFLKAYQRKNGRPFGYDGTDGSVEASFSETPITLKRKKVSKVFIGNAMLSDMDVLFPDCNDTICPGLLQSDNRFDGLCGYDILKHFVVYLVYQPKPYCVFEPI